MADEPQGIRIHRGDDALNRALAEAGERGNTFALAVFMRPCPDGGFVLQKVFREGITADEIGAIIEDLSRLVRPA